MLAIITLTEITAPPGAGRIADSAEVKTNRSAFPGVKVFTFQIIRHLKLPFLQLIESPLLKAFRPFQMCYSSYAAPHHGQRNTF